MTLSNWRDLVKRAVCERGARESLKAVVIRLAVPVYKDLLGMGCHKHRKGALRDVWRTVWAVLQDNQRCKEIKNFDEYVRSEARRTCENRLGEVVVDLARPIIFGRVPKTDAEDVLCQLSLGLWKKLVDGEHRRQIRDLKRYVRRASIIECFLYHRTGKRCLIQGVPEDFADKKETPEKHLEIKDEVHQILLAVRQLSWAQQRIVELLVENCTPAEICEQMHITLSAYRSQIYRMKRTLRKERGATEGRGE